MVTEHKLLVGHIPIRKRILAHRHDVQRLQLITRSGTTHDDGSYFLSRHALFIQLGNGSRIIIQQFAQDIDKKPVAIIEQCEQLAVSLALPFDHLSGDTMAFRNL